MMRTTPLLPSPSSSSSSSSLSLYIKTTKCFPEFSKRATATALGRRISSSSSRRRSLTVRARTNNDDDDAAPGFNPFGFVTDNPSSRNAIQLPESPAQDGNVGQMLYRIEDKGKEFGKYVDAGPDKLRWFVRETGSPDTRRGTILFLHGAPTQSFSFRVVMSQMSDSGFHCLAPDWIGFGFSDMPQPGYGFDYTEKEFHEALDDLLVELQVKTPLFLVVQVWMLSTFFFFNLILQVKTLYVLSSLSLSFLKGFLVGSYGLTWALKNISKVSKLAILNTPLTVSSPVPGLFKQLRIPLFGEFTCQNAITAERFIEAGSPYVLKTDKADVYRLPYLASGAPGFALLEAARKINFNNVLSEVASGLTSERWDKPILVAWGIADKHLPQSVAEEFQKENPGNIKLKLIEGAGHMPQEDWPEKVVEALRQFLY